MVVTISQELFGSRLPSREMNLCLLENRYPMYGLGDLVDNPGSMDVHMVDVS